MLPMESRKKSTIANLYGYSDLSVKAISQQIDMEVEKVKELSMILSKMMLWKCGWMSVTNVEKIMTPIVISLDCQKTARQRLH